MINLDDPRWKVFKGGYQVLYDASVPLKALEKTDDSAEIERIFDELWQGLHHQGDVNIASYMALPHLIRIALDKRLTHTDIPAFVAAIEVQRHNNNELIPEEFEADYEQEIKRIMDVIQLKPDRTWDWEYSIYATAAMAAVNGHVELASVIMHMEEADFAAKYELFMENYEEFEEWLKEKKLTKGRTEANTEPFDNRANPNPGPTAKPTNWLQRIRHGLRGF